MSETERPGTRGQVHEVEIDAPPEAVWRAITEAEEVTRWYVQSAEIDPREVGTYRVSWGVGMDGVSEIVIFDPVRRFRIEHRPMPGQPAIETGPIAEEYTIGTRGGKTVLRLVSSGIPDTEDWDWFYEGTERGWTIFLLGLRHYLERHPGTPREQFVSTLGLPGSLEEGWSALIGGDGLRLRDALEGAAVGDRYAATTAFGQELAGEILMLDPPHRVLATIEGLNDGLLGVTLEEMAGRNFIYLSLATFGVATETVERLREEWSAWLSDLIPAAAHPAEAFEETLGDPAAAP